MSSSARHLARIELAPADFATIARLQEQLGISHVLAQVLVRRGLGDPLEAAAFMRADERHPPERFAGIETAAELILAHVARGSPITVHGDYDCDGVCSTAVLINALRALDADVDWYLPDREADGYGLSAATVDRLASRGTRLLVTADCGITAVAEVAAARAAGLDVVVSDHHAPRADGALPHAAIVHPQLCGYPFTDLCATAVASKLAAALHAAAGLPDGESEPDLDLVAIATVADVVPLRGENRRLVRAGLRALAATTRPGLRALMAVAQVDSLRLDATALAFRLAPRINAAGRLYRPDTALELLLTDDRERAAALADELDRANAERRAVETRILHEAEAQVAEQPEAAALVLAGVDWHPGVIGIVAARVAERHRRPAVLVALPRDGGPGTGSGRSIPAYNLLAGLDAASAHLLRHGGHRAAAGLQIDPASLPAFRASFDSHAAALLTGVDREPVERADAVASACDVNLELAEELERLGPFGAGNPPVALLIPAATLSDPVGFGGERRRDHVRFTVRSGGAQARAVCFGAGAALPVAAGQPVDATFCLERNEWRGVVEARLKLGALRPCVPSLPVLLGEDGGYLERAFAELERELPLPSDVAAASVHEPAWLVRRGAGLQLARGGGDAEFAQAAADGGRSVRDRRGEGIAAAITGLTASGDDVVVVCADAHARARHLSGRLGGFSLCSHDAIDRDPALACAHRHVVVLDPPGAPDALALCAAGPGIVHLIWGVAELRFALHIHEQEYGLRVSLAVLYRDLRDLGGADGEQLETVLRGNGSRARSPALAGRLMRVLLELGLLKLDSERHSVTVLTARGVELEHSEAYRAYTRRLEDGRRFLEDKAQKAA